MLESQLDTLEEPIPSETRVYILDVTPSMSINDVTNQIVGHFGF